MKIQNKVNSSTAKQARLLVGVGKGEMNLTYQKNEKNYNLIEELNGVFRLLRKC